MSPARFSTLLCLSVTSAKINFEFLSHGHDWVAIPVFWCNHLLIALIWNFCSKLLFVQCETEINYFNPICICVKKEHKKSSNNNIVEYRTLPRLVCTKLYIQWRTSNIQFDFFIQSLDTVLRTDASFVRFVSNEMYLV